MKVAWSTIQIQENKTLKLEDVISVTIANYSDDDITFSNNGVKRIIPKFDTSSGMAKEFEIELNNNEFDVNVPITFTGVGNKNVIVDYAKVKQNCN